MTHNASPVEPAAQCPLPEPLPPHRSSSSKRLVGVDLARGLAVFGMYAAHVGPDPAEGGLTGFVMELTHGRASALFAFLAGFSLVLITGRERPLTGRAGRQAIGRVLIRAFVLIVVGTALTKTGTPVDVILAFYGLYFVLALPLYRLRAGTLAAIAAGTALVLPQVLHVVQASIHDGNWAQSVIRYDPFARISGTQGFLDLLFTGNYPALSWISFVIAGMATARLDLRSTAVRLRLAAVGGALVVLGHGGSWLALRLFPDAVDTIGETGGAGYNAPTSAWWSDTAGFPPKSPPAGWLAAGSPHSETTFSILGATGVALIVLVGCLFAIDRLPRVRRAARPIIAVGTMSLTAYVLNIVGIRLLDIRDVPGSSLSTLLGFCVVAALFAVAWLRYFRRGPLEYLLNSATKLARYVK
ncbi:DUF418 domain-containing protein [Embleya sp. AB8]|uniref:DUF418 domain-containing protein n=1 Tax=Embleya sp. AB8 TaxID=3156304 RepID=UPI003C74001F